MEFDPASPLQSCRLSAWMVVNPTFDSLTPGYEAILMRLTQKVPL